MKKLMAILLIVMTCSLSYAEPVFKKGATNQLIEIFISDSASTIGGGLTGLVYNSSGLTAYYYCSGATATSVSLVTMTVGTWASGGFKEIDASNMPGWYQFGIPDAALASGCGSDVNIHFKGATNMVPLPFAISLVDNVEADTYAKVSPLTYTVANKLDSNVYTWNGTAVATPDTAGYPVVTIKDGTGTGEIDTASGTVILADASLSEAKYAANENPAELILVTPSQKLVTDASGHVTVAAGSKTGYSLAADQSGVTVGTVNALGTQAKADVNAEADTAISDYDPPTYTELLNMIRVALRKDSALATDLSALLTTINANLGSGGGTYANTADSQEAIRDQGDAAWTGGGATAADVWNYGSGRTITGGTVTTLTNAPQDSSGVGTLLTRVPDTVSLANINAEVDTALNTAIPGTPTADSINERVKTLDDNYTSTKAGYLDAAITSRSSQTSVDTVAGYVDTEVGAIKTKTDQLAFTVANQVDANALTGGGGDDAATIWGYGTRVLTGNTNLNDPTAAAIADAVWDEAATGHTDAGKAGAQLWTDIDAILVDTTEIGTAGAGLTNIDLPDQTMNITGNLSGSVGSVTGAVGSVTGAVGSVTGNVGGNVTGSVGSVTGAVGSVTGAVGSVTGDVGGNVVGSVASVTGAVGSVTGNVGGNVTGSVGSLGTQAKTDVQNELITYDAVVPADLDNTATVVNAIYEETTAEARSAGTYGQLLKDNVNATISSRATQTSVDAVDDYVDTEIADIVTKIGTPAGASMSADIAAVQADTDDIQTRVPTVAAKQNIDQAYDGTGYAGEGIMVIIDSTNTSAAVDMIVDVGSSSSINSDKNLEGKMFYCSLLNEERKIVKTVNGIPDLISVEPGNPFTNPPGNGADEVCFIR